MPAVPAELAHQLPGAGLQIWMSVVNAAAISRPSGETASVVKAIAEANWYSRSRVSGSDSRTVISRGTLRRRSNPS